MSSSFLSSLLSSCSPLPFQFFPSCSLFSHTGRTTRAADSSSSWRRYMLQSAPPGSRSGCHRPTARRSCTPSFTVLPVVSEPPPPNSLLLVSAGNCERASDRATTEIRGSTDRARSGGPDARWTERALGAGKRYNSIFLEKRRSLPRRTNA
jgi:hypothetical protein